MNLPDGRFLIFGVCEGNAFLTAFSASLRLLSENEEAINFPSSLKATENHAPLLLTEAISTKNPTF